MGKKKVPEKYVRLIMVLYRNVKKRVKTLLVGPHQSSVLSSFLFNAVFDDAVGQG